jgi:hypothetical protein
MVYLMTTLESPASLKSTFDDFADFSNVNDWDPTVSSAAQFGRKQFSVGSRCKVTMDILLRPLAFDYLMIPYI